MSTPKSKPSIAEQIEAFEKLVAWFDGDDFELEVALEKYRQAEVLSKKIEKQLSVVKNEVTVLKQKLHE